VGVTASGLIEPLFLPPPSAVLQKGWLLATSGYMDSTCGSTWARA
jgi:taurine transport system permease protein